MCNSVAGALLTESRIRYQVRSAGVLDYVAESQKLIALIKQYDGMNM